MGLDECEKVMTSLGRAERDSNEYSEKDGSLVRVFIPSTFGVAWLIQLLLVL